MEIELGLQIKALLLALFMGAGLGILYDALRPVRRKTGRAGGAVLDTLFCMAAAAAVFIYAMGADSGRLGIWELASALIGFLVYMHTLSGPVLRVFTALLELFCEAVAACKKIVRRLSVSAKKFCHGVREYMRGKIQSRKAARPGGHNTCKKTS